MAEVALLLDADHVAAVEELGPDPSIQLHPDDQAATKQLAEDDETSSSSGDSAEEAPTESSEEERRDDELCRFYRPLHKAALNGDWESAERFFIVNPEADITRGINRTQMSILHIAANMGHAEFIRKLVAASFFPKEALTLKDKYGFTALHYAASFGSLSTVKFLVSLDNRLTQIPNGDGDVSLRSAADNKVRREVIWYLTKKTANFPDSFAFSGVDGAGLIVSLVTAGQYDICLYLFNQYPNLASDAVRHWKESSPNCDLIGCLVSRPSEFPSGSKLTFWEMCIYHLIPMEAPVSVEGNFGASHLQPPSILLSTRIRSKMLKGIQWILGAVLKYPLYIVPGFKHIRDEKYKHKCIIQLLDITCRTMSDRDIHEIVSYFKETEAHYLAAEYGETEIIRAFFDYFPDIMDDVAVDFQILTTATRFRQENVYNIMMERGIAVKFFPKFADEHRGDNILHTAALLGPFPRRSSVPCPALQVQRELQWFKGVEKFVPPYMKILENKRCLTPQELFTTEHMELVRDAEMWMKDTSMSWLTVATLIITIVFAAAFTFPGGNIEGIGIPVFLRRNEFVIFVISDAIGMFASAASILMFLSILTARYAEEDFIHSLPKRFMFGLAFLLIAIASMMVTFGVAVYMVLNPRFKWIIYPIIGFTCIPLGIFALLHLPLFIYMARSTYGNILKPMKSSE